MKNKSVLRLAAEVFGRSVLASVMCLIVSISVLTLLPATLGRFLAQLFDFVIFGTLIYSPMWQEGNSDVNKVNYGHIREDRYKGLKVGLIAGIPGFLAAFLPILAKLRVINEGFVLLYRFLTPAFFPFYQTILPATLTLAEVGFLNVAAASLTFVLLPGLCFAGYWLGYLRVSIAERLIYVNPEANKKKKKKRA